MISPQAGMVEITPPQPSMVYLLSTSASVVQVFYDKHVHHSYVPADLALGQTGFMGGKGVLAGI